MSNFIAGTDADIRSAITFRHMGAHSGAAWPGADATIFARPTTASIVFSDIESRVLALGGAVTERQGSRVKMRLHGEQWHCHRPHPGNEAKRYQVEEARELLERARVKP